MREIFLSLWLFWVCILAPFVQMSEGEIQKTESEIEYMQEIFKTDLHFFILSSNK